MLIVLVALGVFFGLVLFKARGLIGWLLLLTTICVVGFLHEGEWIHVTRGPPSIAQGVNP